MSLRLGTDFSGIDAPLQALRNLGVCVEYLFASEIAADVREHVRLHGSPDRLYDDVTTRDHTELPHVDLYVAGFPCQSFSLRGAHRGTSEPRGLLVQHSLAYIRHARPRVVVFENVPGLLTPRHRALLDETVTAMRSMGYSVDHRVLSARDFGCPQNRKRLFIVGIHGVATVPWPVAADADSTVLLEAAFAAGSGGKRVTLAERSTPRYEALISSYRTQQKAKGHDATRLAIFDMSRATACVCRPGTAPCITSGGNAHRLLWSTGDSYVWANVHHVLALQGFPPDYPLHGMSESRMRVAVGNSMVIGVMAALFANLLPFCADRKD